MSTACSLPALLICPTATLVPGHEGTRHTCCLHSHGYCRGCPPSVCNVCRGAAWGESGYFRVDMADISGQGYGVSTAGMPPDLHPRLTCSHSNIGQHSSSTSAAAGRALCTAHL